MGYLLHGLSIAFAVLKAAAVINWSWWLVFTPSIIAISMWLSIVLILAWLRAR